VDITVTTPVGTSATSNADRFSYLPPSVPLVDAVLPGHGTAAGGTAVQILGSGFIGATAVAFGTTTLAPCGTSVPEPCFSPNGGETGIFALSPPGTAGTTVDVTVSAPGGTSSISGFDKFTFEVPGQPVVTGVSPQSGPPGGGTTVFISGRNLVGATSVNFGGVSSTRFFPVSPGVIQAVSPPGAPGSAVHVTVTTPGGTSLANAADQFTYTGARFAASAFIFHNESANPSVATSSVTSTGDYHDAVGASQATSGLLGFTFSLGNNSVVCASIGNCTLGPSLTGATISASSSKLSASQFPGLQQPPSSSPCPAVTRDRSSPFPITWAATAPVPSSPSPTCSNFMNVADLNSPASIPLTVTTGYDSSRSVSPAVLAPGTTAQTTTIAVTLPTTPQWTTRSQIVVAIQPRGPISTSSSSVSAVCAFGPGPPPTNPSPCLQPDSNPAHGSWILNFPQPGTTYTFSVTANITNSSPQHMLSLPAVQVTGIPHSPVGGDVFGSSSGTSAAINDRLVSTATISATFSVDQSAQWNTVLQVDKFVAYPSFFAPAATPTSIQSFVTQDLASGAISNVGVANSLLAKLAAAATARASGDCTTAGNVYGAFVNALNAQSGKMVAAAAASALIADAKFLIANCP
jgi:hypothetical protein